jgi:hypothetical protein
MKEARAVMIHKSDPASTPTGTAEVGRAQDSLDMSMGGVPQKWVDAQQEAPIPYGEYDVLSRAARFDVIPTGSREGAFVANAAAAAASLLCGTAWYVMDVAGIYSGPWLAPVVGALVALAVRVVASNAEAAYRAVLSVASYLFTLTVILILLTHRDLAQIYESIESFQVYESTLVRTRLQDPLHVGAYLLGAFLAAQVGYFRSED